jgi:hypothetical protein
MSLDANKSTVVAFYDLMFNQCQRHRSICRRSAQCPTH